ncbi:MAG: FlgD immunoglobulin-like domain containing protein [bacterium]
MNTKQDAGRHQVAWDGKDDKGKMAASGIYFYRIITGQTTQSRSMLLLQ